jgi:betaine-aldehyde dehydrogenase
VTPQRDCVLGYIEAGRAEGATLVAGGGRRPDGPGYFVEPTIFAGVDNDMTIAREEIFGPVGSVIPFDDPDDAIRLANTTAYGLAATIWTRDVSQARLLTRKVRAGGLGQRVGRDRPRAALGRHEDRAGSAGSSAGAGFWPTPRRRPVTIVL